MCEKPLIEAARHPICADCLKEPAPLTADYFCASCRTPFTTPYPLDEAGLCGLCRRGMNGFDTSASYGFYEGVLQKLIHLYKYHGIYTLAKPLADHLMTALPRQDRIDAIVPVPMHWLKQWRRGFNQSELLAEQVSRRTGVPLLKAMRRRSAPPQAALSDHERRRNVARAFEVAKAVRGLHVLLVDDVLTTGATASACGAALKRAGAARVMVLTLARTDRRVAVPLVRVRAKSKTGGGW